MLGKVDILNNGKLIVFGNINGQAQLFKKKLGLLGSLDSLLRDNYICFVGNASSVDYTIEDISIYKKIIDLQKSGKVFFVRGVNELAHIRKARERREITDLVLWMEKQPLVVGFSFNSTNSVTVLHGGIKPNSSWYNISNDIDSYFVNDILSDKEAEVSSKSWHHYYDGRFGYVVSGGSSDSDGLPKYYSYSCNINTRPEKTGRLCVQIFNQNRIESTLI